MLELQCTERIDIIAIDNGGDEVVAQVQEQIEIVGVGIGVKGDSAYGVWLSLGNIGTEQDFIDSLRGPSLWGGISGDINTQQDLMSTMLAFSVAL